MPEWLYPGRKVVCVDNSQRFPLLWAPGARPQLNAVYTVASLGPDYFGHPKVFFIELQNLIPLRPDIGDYGYNINRFRPLNDRPTSIASLKKLLRPLKVMEKDLVP